MHRSCLSLWRSSFLQISIIGLLLGGGSGLAHADTCFAAPSGLLAWWPGDVDATDIAGANHGVLLNGATVVAGRVSQAFILDGLDDFVQVADSPALRPSTFTIDAWIKTSLIPSPFNAQFIVARSGADGSHGYELATNYTSGSLRAGVLNGANFAEVEGTTNVADGQWHLAAFTYDGQTLRLYVDGQQQAQLAFALGPGYIAGDPLLIGNRQYAACCKHLFEGLIDEVEVFDRALSSVEIQAIYDAGSAGKCKDEAGDGFGPPQDCDETSSAINPNATELLGNFTDENCDGNLGACDPCGAWRNHGEYVRCVSHEVEALVAASVITQDEGDALVSSAARSDVGKKGFVPAECQP
mgnify:CR=1 FL=1